MAELMTRLRRKLRVSAAADAPPPPVATSFTVMKKPFAMRTSRLLSGLTDALGNYSEESDKVKLLSVLSKSGFGDDGSDSSSSDGGISRSVTFSSDDSPTSRRAQPSASPEVTPCDPHVSLTDLLLIDLHAPVADSLACDIKCDSPTGKGPPTRPHTAKPQSTSDGRQEHLEWVFTLYNFDGKGVVTKQDIGSLVRSIYDVLENTRIPLSGSSERAGKTRNGLPIGSFKVKLSVLAESEKLSVGADAAKCGGSTRKVPVKEARRRRRQAQLPPAPPKAPAPRHRHSEDAPRPNNPRPTPAVRPFSIDLPVASGDGAPCVACDHRDYVNLSELENCCAGGSAGAHRLRHCARHCSCSRRCPPTTAERAACSRPTCATNTAYYMSRQQLLMAKREERRSPSPPPSTHFFGDATTPPERRRHRPLQRARAMAEVREWVARDGCRTAAVDASCLAPPSPPDRLFVEHKHVHEHHHYVHAV